MSTESDSTSVETKNTTTPQEGTMPDEEKSEQESVSSNPIPEKPVEDATEKAYKEWMASDAGKQAFERDMKRSQKLQSTSNLAAARAKMESEPPTRDQVVKLAQGQNLGGVVGKDLGPNYGYARFVPGWDASWKFANWEQAADKAIDLLFHPVPDPVTKVTPHAVTKGSCSRAMDALWKKKAGKAAAMDILFYRNVAQPSVETAPKAEASAKGTGSLKALALGEAQKLVAEGNIAGANDLLKAVGLPTI